MSPKAVGVVLAALVFSAQFCFAQSDGAARGAPPIHGLALGAGEGGGAAFADSPYYPANAKLWWAAGLSLEIPVWSVLGLGLSLGFRGTGASAPQTGVIYKGHHGLDLGAYVYGRGPLSGAGGPVELLWGVAAGATAGFEVYSLTELLFFYPSLLLEPYLELHFPRLGAHTLGLSLPARLDFRKDLDLSASVGLGLRWRWYPGWNKEKS